MNETKNSFFVCCDLEETSFISILKTNVLFENFTNDLVF